MSRDESQHPDSLGFLNYAGALQAGDDLKIENGTVEAAEACVSSLWSHTRTLGRDKLKNMTCCRGRQMVCDKCFM